VIAYLDTSVVLRVILEQAAPLPEWDELYAGVSSTLLRVECQRSLDRAWHHGSIAEETIALKGAAAEVLIRRLQLVDLDEQVLAVAGRPLPVPLGTLDAIHLATAIVFRNAQPTDERPIVFATHDIALARAARAMHFDVIGVTA
jgi:predicted nucleic acid-binding protein